MGTPLRLILVTHGPLTVHDDVFFRRLLKDPAFDVAAIVVDDGPWHGRAKTEQNSHWGELPPSGRWRFDRPWIGSWWKMWERDHPTRGEPPRFDRFAQLGVPVHRLGSLCSSEYANLIASLQPDLAVLRSSRPLEQKLAGLPRHGTVQLEMHKLPDYRGSGPIGFWELIDGQNEIGVTVHYSKDALGMGDILGQRSITIEPFDTLKSLQIKGTIQGLELYHEVLRTLAEGSWDPVASVSSLGRVCYPPTRQAEDELEMTLQERQHMAYAPRQAANGYEESATTWMKYALMYPLLMHKKRQLVKAGQAPIIVLFYHRVSNDAGNLGTLPLEYFVEQVELIRRYHPILSLEEACRRLDSGRSDEIAFVLTFDDGYAADIDTSIPYLRFFEIPATFFVSIGNILEARLFEHDTSRGITVCPPMTLEQLRSLQQGGFGIGSHGLYHESCGGLESSGLEREICESKRRLERVLGAGGRHFAFPRGIKGIDIKRDGWELAAATYDAIASAYSGFNFAKDGKKHIKRFGGPFRPIHLIRLMDGFTGISDLTRNNLWGFRLSHEPAY